jgi:hypothetical protein
MLPYVRQSGYLPFYSEIFSHHRGASIDIDEIIISGTATPDEPLLRKIGTKIRLLEFIRYKEYLHRKFEKLRVYNKSKQLYEEAEKEETQGMDFLHRLNALDTIVTQFCLSMDKIVKPKVQRSVKSHSAHQVVHYWNLKAKEKLNRIDTTIQQQTVRETMPPEWKANINNNRRKIKAALRHTKKVYAAIKRQEREAKHADIMEESKAMASCEGTMAESLLLLRTGQSEVQKTFNQLKVQFK